MYFAHNITTIYILRFLIGLGNGGEYGIGMALIAEHFAAKQYGRVSSIAAIGGQIDSILAAVLSALILPRLGWHVLFLVGVFPGNSCIFYSSKPLLQINKKKINLKFHLAVYFQIQNDNANTRTYLYGSCSSRRLSWFNELASNNCSKTAWN